MTDPFCAPATPNYSYPFIQNYKKYKGPWTALPVPMDPKLVSFQTEKRQTFITCKISWLVESIESDWGASFLGARGKYEIVIGHLKGALYKIDLLNQGSRGVLCPPSG